MVFVVRSAAMRPHLPLSFALLVGACSSPTANVIVDAAATDAGTAPDIGSPAVDVPAAVDVRPTVDVQPAVDVPARTYTPMPALSETPVRRFDAAPAAMLVAGSDYRATIVTDAGTFTIDLFEDATPISVNSFVWLARHRFYEGIAFHRVIEGFVAQGGDPNTVSGARTTWGRGGPGYMFGTEVTDELRFDGPGVLGMARSASLNSNGSQFYLTLAKASHLDGQYTVFGRVLGSDGLAVLDRIERGAADAPPTTPTRIMSVTILVAAP